MDVEAHNRLRKRIREIIAERHNLKEVPERTGGFLHLLPLVASALPSVIEAGRKLVGAGKHGEEAKTRKPNLHAQLVKKLMKDHKDAGRPLSLAEASKMAKAIRSKKK